MRYYELTIITTQDLPQLPIQPVREQRGPNFITLEFYAEPEKIQELEKKLKAENVRHMILVKEPQKEIKIRRRAAIKESSSAPSFAEASAGKKTPEQKGKKVDLKEIDKKIEEILNE